MTLEIIYEGRTHNAEVEDKPGMDATFADVFSETNLQERMEILGYGSRTAYLEAETTIAAKARYLVKHYPTHVFPNGYKAQIVAASREAAVGYKKHVDAAVVETIAALEETNPLKLDLARLKQLKSDVVTSSNHSDELHLTPYTNASKLEATIKTLKLPFGKKGEGVSGDVGIVIVNNMLLAAFDAPLEG